MSILKLTKTLPDNRVVEYHKVAEVQFDAEPNHMVVKLSSYVNLADATTQAAGDAMFMIPMTYTGTYEDALTDVLGKVMQLPDWSGGEIVTE
jgi:hypothetical protein